ncbi:MAG: FkbM family methyltransferase [Bacteroidetes bacterium]|nr:FkbM family methyltransferase [Bacteroidota bacterium]
MITFIKKIIYRILGMKAYLRALHSSFFILFDTGFLKSNFIYKYHYFVKHLIKPNDVIVDLGANLGYYTKIFCRLTNEQGKVIAIEPVKPFFDTVAWSVKNYKQAILFNHALGLEQKMITLSTPKEYGYLRAGLSHVEENPTLADNFVFESEMVKGSELLKNFDRINYIKCDIEGYEEFVLPEIKEIIRKHQPILQIESWGKHLEVVEAMMKDLGYSMHSVYKNKLIENFDNNIEHGDYIFLPAGRKSDILSNLKTKGLA